MVDITYAGLGVVIGLIIVIIIGWYFLYYRERKLKKILPEDFDITKLPEKALSVEELKKEVDKASDNKM